MMPSQKTVLLIEDNPDLRAATGDALKSLGYDVIAATGDAPTLEIAREASFDLVLVNAYPAEGRGLDTLDRVRRLAPGTPAVVTSGFGNDAELRQRVESGDVAFLPVPFSLAALARTIERQLERSASSEPRPKIPVSAARGAGRARRRRFEPWLAAAAGLLVASGLVLRFGGLTPSLPPPDLDSTRRGSTIHLVEPVGEIQSVPSHFVWRESPGVVAYKVVLETVDQTVLWEAETQTASLELPQWLIEELHPSVTYHWQVEGFDENRSTVGKSDLAAFSARPRRRDHLSPPQPGRETLQGAPK